MRQIAMTSVPEVKMSSSIRIVSESDDDRLSAWYKQHRFILTTDEDPTDEVSYIAMLYAREAVKEWRRQHDRGQFKRDIVRQLLRGRLRRRIEDKFAVGSLDMLRHKRYTIYAEAKLLKDIAALPASVMQREQIRLVNAVDNPYCRALVIGLKVTRSVLVCPGKYERALQDGLAHYQSDRAPQRRCHGCLQVYMEGELA